MEEELEALVAEAGRYGLSAGTLFQAAADFGCGDEAEAIRHIRVIVADQRRDVVARALAQPGARSAMASGTGP